MNVAGSTTGAGVLDLVARGRAAGLDLAPSAAIDLAGAVAVLGPRGLSDLYWAGRATLVHRPEDIAPYDEAFSTLLADLGAIEPTTPLALVRAPGVDPDHAIDPRAEARAPRDQHRIASSEEVLRSLDLAALGDHEDEVHRHIRQLVLRPAQRRSRRRRPDRRGRGRLDVHRTARRALRTEGETFDRIGTRRRTTPRRLVMLLDISGSMEPYADAFLRLAHAARVGGRRVEVFAVGTRLTRLTRALDAPDAEAALHAVAAEIPDWAGGTRLGEGLRTFNDEWGIAGLARGAVVVILSDGWDRGDPALLGEQMARLARVTHTIVWVNPLRATEGYAPLARGMAAALPHVDHFVSGHSLAALDEVAAVVAS